MAIILVSALVAPIIFRAVPRYRLLGIGLLVLSAVAGIHRLLSEPSLISGLFGVSPWMLTGLISLRYKLIPRLPALMLVLSATIATIGILASAYGEGGSTEWGGRFFHGLIPLVAPLAVLGLSDLVERLPRGERWVSGAAITVTAVALSLAGVRMNVLLRQRHASIAGSVTATASGTDSQIVVFTSLSGSGVSRIFWPLETREDIAVLSAPNLSQLPDLLADIPSNDSEITLASNIAPDLLDAFLAKTAAAEWRVQRVASQEDDLFNVVVLSR